MKNRAFWASAVLIVVAWSLYNLIPIQGNPLFIEFQQRVNPGRRDAAWTNILTQLVALQKANPQREYGNLIEAIGTNDIIRYFSFPEASKQDEPTRYILNRLQRDAAGKVRLGLDLQGGTSFLVMMDTSAILGTNTVTGTNATGEVMDAATAEYKRDRALSQAVEVLRRRVDKFGVSEPIIQPVGKDRILIQLPGLSEEDRSRAMTNIQKAAFLEFRLVHPNSEELIRSGMIEPGYEILKERRKNPNGTDSVLPYVVQKRPVRGFTGKYLARAMPDRHQMTGMPVIRFELNSAGAKLFGEITEQNVGRQLAIVLDGVLYSAPNINEPILGGSGEITGSFSPEQAQELAAVLENPLEAPLKIIESREVDPSLGKDSISSGLRAAIIGTVAVALFMIVYYLLSGLIANVALILNIIILLGVMCYVKTTLTLPGIAGIVLTIGMAVDANVLIYERIREELAAGKSIRGAISAGYSKAFGTIFDSNLTTLIASVILIFMGTGPVKGFGVALTIGVSVSMFTALIVTRLIFEFMLDRDWIKRLPMLHIIRGSKIQFMKWSRPAFVASWMLIMIGIGYGVFRQASGSHPIFGPDFVGGDQQTYAFAQKVDVDKLRSTLGALGIGDATIAYQRDIVGQTENLSVTTKFGTAAQVDTALKQAYPDAKFKQLGLSQVGPVVGKEITRTAILASLLAMFGILIYVAFRYEFTFAIGAVVAIIHDILMTLGLFFLSGRELNAPIVAAILTIIGFSINDTIVIFDRIREDLKLGIRGTFVEIMNQALNQTLSRTIITSGTVFLSTLSLYLFGGGVVNDFAFTFLCGILTGTYSSIYIASALVLWLNKGQRPTIGHDVVSSGSEAEMTLNPAAAKG
jgi:SecD/SecF fusion protein